MCCVGSPSKPKPEINFCITEPFLVLTSQNIENENKVEIVDFTNFTNASDNSNVLLNRIVLIGYLTKRQFPKGLKCHCIDKKNENNDNLFNCRVLEF